MLGIRLAYPVQFGQDTENGKVGRERCIGLKFAPFARRGLQPSETGGRMNDYRAKRPGVWACGVIACIALSGWHQSGRSQVAQSPAPGPTAAAIGVGPAISNAEADGLIFERQQLMLGLDKDAKTLGMIAAGSHPKEDLAKTTRSIADGARESAKAFEQIVPGGRSKPEVWSNHAAFQGDMNQFASKAEAMAKAGATGNLDAVTGLMIEALPCKQCHDNYRAPKAS